jgi:hypothetical protein
MLELRANFSDVWQGKELVAKMKDMSRAERCAISAEEVLARSSESGAGFDLGGLGGRFLCFASNLALPRSPRSGASGAPAALISRLEYDMG